jgi:hypothetical protein
MVELEIAHIAVVASELLVSALADLYHGDAAAAGQLGEENREIQTQSASGSPR